MPPPMPPSPENLRGADLLRHRCMYGSKLMSSDEIENILRIQEKFLTSGVPYNEDYYYLVSYHYQGLPLLHDCGPYESVWGISI